MTHGELVGIWAALVVDGAVRAGVREAVIAPGSRSTPFALLAMRHPLLRCHSIVDERSAAFFALGQARITDAPTLVICTSGTAGAHFLPAALEASASGVPLLLLTADRPFELQDCGAPQTVDQTALLGQATRRFVDLGQPVAEESALRAVYRRVVQATLATRLPVPGPVHINARVGKPLEPEMPRSAPGKELGQAAQRIRAEGPSVPPAGPSGLAPMLADSLPGDLAAARRGLIVCGALPATFPAEEIHELARETRLPLVAEAASQARFHGSGMVLCDGLEALLLAPEAAAALRPDFVLQLGAAPLGPTWEAVFEQAHSHHVLHPHRWSDPSRRATSVAVGDVPQTLRRLRERLTTPDPELRAAREHWASRLMDLCRAAWTSVDQVIGGDEKALREAGVLRQVVASLPPGGVLSLGNSLPIRELDRYVPAWSTPHPVLTQRGINGIDGLISAAAGAAAVRSPVTLILGDVSFMHDVGGLWAASRSPGQLVVVVIHNGGGRIFEQLPIADVTRGDELAFWTTPHDFDLRHAAALYGIAFTRASTPAELDTALRTAYGTPGSTLIEARVPAEDPRDTARLLQRQLRDSIDTRALRALT